MEHIRKQLSQQILGGNAFKPIEEILEEVPFDKLGQQIEGLPYTFWQQFEHIRITQRDILDYSLNQDYRELSWPKDYWPESTAPENSEEWEQRKEAFLRDRETMLGLIQNVNQDLCAAFEHAHGHTLFREGLLVLEHNAYHTGQLMVILRLINHNKNNGST